MDRLSVPPFWELEDLLRNGLALDGALGVMAARRTGPALIAGEAAHRAPRPIIPVFHRFDSVR